MELGRLLLSAGRSEQAGHVFEAILRDRQERGCPLDCAAFYLGLCHERKGREQAAATWYRRAAVLAEQQDGGERRAAYYAGVLGTQDHPSNPGLVASRALAPLGPAQPRRDDSLGRQDLIKVYRDLDEARSKYRKDSGNILNQIHYMSSLFLHSEIVSLPFPDFRRYETAGRGFQEARELLDRLVPELDDPRHQAEIRQHPEYAMRLDFVQVRLAKIDDKRLKNHDLVVGRNAALRMLVKAYRDCSDHALSAYQSFVLSDFGELEQSHNGMKSALGLIKGLVAARRNEGDMFLFGDEPKGAIPTKDEEELMHLPPFERQVEGRLESLHALAAYSLGSETTGGARAGLLEAASRGAEAAKAIAGDNPIGFFVKGMVSEAQALDLTAPNPASPENRRKAQALFEEARSSLGEAKKLLARHVGLRQARSKSKNGVPLSLAMAGNESASTLLQRAVPPVLRPQDSKLAKLVEDHLRELSGPGRYLTDAVALTEKGRIDEALSALRKGMERAEARPDPEGRKRLWLAFLETGLRARIGADELRQVLRDAESGQILSQEDFAPLILRAKIGITSALHRMATTPSQPMDDAGRRSLVRDLDEARTDIVDALAACDRGRTDQNAGERDLVRAQSNAYLALALALRGAVTPVRTGESEADERRAYYKARAAKERLEEGLRRGGPDQLELREAHIACLLALGHLAASIEKRGEGGLPEAAFALAGAIDDLAKLPFESSRIKLMGSSLIAALAANDLTSFDAARGERRLRQAMGHFVSGTFSLHLGQPAAAEKEMTRGLESAQRPVAAVTTRGRVPDAETLMAEGGDGTGTPLATALESFRILSRLDAGLAGDALVAALRMVGPKNVPPRSTPGSLKTLDKRAIDRAVDSIATPLEGFALARALEDYAASLSPGILEQRTTLIEQSRRALARTSELLGDMPAERLVGLRALLAQAAERLSGPRFHEETAAQLRSQMRLDDAATAVDAGLRRFPRDPLLWGAKIGLALDRLELQRNADTTSCDGVLKLIETWKAIATDAGPDVYFWEGRVRERMGRWDLAQGAYERALHDPRLSPAERIRTRARLAESRVHLEEARRTRIPDRG